MNSETNIVNLDDIINLIQFTKNDDENSDRISKNCPK